MTAAPTTAGHAPLRGQLVQLTPTQRTAEKLIADGYGILPTKADDPKHVVYGYTRERVGHVTVDDFAGGRGIKIVTGWQPNGLFLGCGDDDAGGKLRARLAGADEMLNARSTDGGGFHLWFASDVPFKTGKLIDPDTGEYLGELHGDGGLGVTFPTDDRIISGDFFHLPVYEAESVETIKRLAGYVAKPEPEYQPKEHTSKPRSTASGIEAYNARTDLVSWFESIGGKFAGWRNGVAHIHCPDHAAHKRGDKNPSLRVYPSAKYGQVAGCNHAGCRFYETRHAFGHLCEWEGLSAVAALKRYNPIAQPVAQPVELPETPQAPEEPTAPVVLERSLQRRIERADKRDTALEAIAERLEADKQLPERAKVLGRILLEHGTLQVKATNKALAEKSGGVVRSIQRGFVDLANAGYGKREGGYSPCDTRKTWELATWTWKTTEAPEAAPVRNVPEAITDGDEWPAFRMTATMDAGDEAQKEADPHQEAKGSNCHPLYMNHSIESMELGKKEVTAAPALVELVPAACDWPGGASYNPAQDCSLLEPHERQAVQLQPHERPALSRSLEAITPWALCDAPEQAEQAAIWDGETITDSGDRVTSFFPSFLARSQRSKPLRKDVYAGAVPVACQQPEYDPAPGIHQVQTIQAYRPLQRAA